MYIPLYDLMLIFKFLNQDKSAVHKLFKVLVPRYQDFTTCYTRLLIAPRKIQTMEELQHPRIVNSAHPLHPAIVELKGNPFPPLIYSNSKPNKKHIHNVLLAEAKRDLDRFKID